MRSLRCSGVNVSIVPGPEDTSPYMVAEEGVVLFQRTGYL
jgi:hypothetical protein